jgi:hypothetical protein
MAGLFPIVNKVVISGLFIASQPMINLLPTRTTRQAHQQAGERP